MKRNTATNTMTSKRIQALALLGAALLSATALAGCTAAQATASQLQPQADDRAAAWDADAQLVTIVGTEGSIPMQTMMGAWEGTDIMDSPAFDEAKEQAFWDRVQDDPDPGDGQAEFWLYIYRNGAGDNHLIVTVDREKEIIYEKETEEGAGLGVPVGDYNVDSDQAVRIALDENEHLADALETDHFGFVIALGRENPDDNPSWVVAGGGGGQQGGGGGLVIIDARNGNVEINEGQSGNPGAWPQ